MQKKATDELVGWKRHGLLASPVSVVSPSESDLALIETEQPIVGDGDTVSVTSQVIQDSFGTTERRLSIDGPLQIPTAFEEPFETVGVVQVLESTVKLQLM